MDDDFVMISPQQKVMEESDIENQLDNVNNETVIDIEDPKPESPDVEKFLSEEELINMIKDDLDFINRRIPCLDSDCNMTDSCTQTSDIEEDDIPTTSSDDDKNIFTSIIEYMFGDEGVVTHMFDNFPTLEEMRDNFKESSVYRFFSFIFK